MLIAGIDPGKTGGIAILENGKVQNLTLLSSVSPRQLLLKHGVQLAYIEQAQSFPKQGIASAFNYGRDYGYLLGSLAGSGIAIVLVRPGVWTKKVHAMAPKINDPKEKSLWCAKHIWPDISFLATDRSSKPHDGLVDAALIAYYGMLNERAEVSTIHAINPDAPILD